MSIRRVAALLGTAVVLAFGLSQVGAVAFQADQKPAEKPAAQQKPAAGQPRSEKKPDESMRTFMRAKLAASTKILEGLALEDLDLVREGAVELNRMSTAEKWRRHDDMLYRQFSAEFRQTTADLIESSKQGLLDRSALKWMDATMNCIECHRYVRNKLVVEK